MQGKLFVKSNAGYKAGIQMKVYKEKVPVTVICKTAGNFSSSIRQTVFSLFSVMYEVKQ